MEELLKKIADEVPEVDSLLIVDEEGIIVYRYDKEILPIDAEELAVHLVGPVVRISEFFKEESVEGDELKELVLFSKNFVLLIYPLVNDTYLVVLSKRSPLYGRTRFKVGAKMREILKAL